MATELTLPELGENVSSGDVVRILVKAGDTIKKDQAVLELETDKATIEVPSDVDGTVDEIKVKQGDKVKVGQVVLTLKTADGTPTTEDQTRDAKPETEEKKADEAPKADGPEPEGDQPAAAVKAEPEKVVDIASR
ncbi:MAG: biotin/lipoyl-binding protein, partial [Acidobacteriota bacterium]|nr:biotin/lipoyl-binding protein [Acidobacteriota bacterium]